MRHHLDPQRTTWHITFGTYGTRLHGDDRPTVDRDHNELGEPFLEPDPKRWRGDRNRMKAAPVYLTREQCLFIQLTLIAICARGGWTLRTCSAASDHVHLVIDIIPAVHGEKARRLIKRWLTQALNERWPRAEGLAWWADEGSNKVVGNEDYLNPAVPCVFNQRMV